MTKSVLAIAALAAALSTAAFAADVKSTQPAPMTDEQLDAVTAAGGNQTGNGSQAQVSKSYSGGVNTGVQGNQSYRGQDKAPSVGNAGREQ